jgi:2-dehydro-3-deoxyphosphooctonate aldolase (KDO 8-P synthase)
LTTAGETGKYVNIKKAQFMAPEDVLKAAEKVKITGNNKILITERGTCFGYHDLIVDFRSMLMMKQSEYPVIYDATHSVQQPSVGVQSGGRPEFIESLAYSAVSLGIGGLFFETHPDPKSAKSDASTQLSLDKAEKFIINIVKLNSFIRESIVA